MPIPVRLVLVLVPLLAGAAACTTPYRPQAFARGGYSEVRVDRNVFRVTFAGTTTMRQGETDEMVLLRAAEVSLNNGFPYFISSGPAATGTALSAPGGVLAVPSSTLTITCYDFRPETSAVVHDANRIVEVLGAKHAKS